MEETYQRLQHYGVKSTQHLSRVRLSHCLAVKALSSEYPTDSLERRLVQSSFDENESGELLQKLPKVLHEIHLVALKADFELYLNRVATVAWSSQLNRLNQAPVGCREKLAELLKKSSLSRDELIYGLTGVQQADGDQTLLVDKIVPRQGLDALTDCLQVATGVSLHTALDKTQDGKVWAQIAVAFEVRHLIEHRDGKVDLKFRRAVKRHWPNSTWARSLVTEVRKVGVEYEDVKATYEAMLQATNLLNRDLLEWCSMAKA